MIVEKEDQAAWDLFAHGAMPIVVGFLIKCHVDYDTNTVAKVSAEMADSMMFERSKRMK